MFATKGVGICTKISNIREIVSAIHSTHSFLLVRATATDTCTYTCILYTTWHKLTFKIFFFFMWWKPQSLSFIGFCNILFKTLFFPWQYIGIFAACIRSDTARVSCSYVSHFKSTIKSRWTTRKYDVEYNWTRANESIWCCWMNLLHDIRCLSRLFSVVSYILYLLLLMEVLMTCSPGHWYV